MAGPLSGIGAQQTTFTQFQPGGTDQQTREKTNTEQTTQTAQGSQPTQPQGTRSAASEQSNYAQNNSQNTSESRAKEVSASSNKERGTLVDIEV